MTIPMPWPGRVQTGLRGKSIIVRVVIIDAVAGVKQTKKFPLNIPCSWDIFFSLLCPKRLGLAALQGKYLKKAASRVRGCCSLTFKES